ncbi:carbohydrate ABC transporter permease [Bifidobacterium miconisargentati]|uniref:carbohydrate ABC transporter permease n=1 Tax=Bifidobacterium miconisargentati TaxID=2834437 RepID=UPI001BDC4877|nr:sugar ABC transporter permease [Bifidobacterium miconisargentati]MBW3090552.1 sugar ABC transporter permease [Bifidobacterium miconisargentati]
MMNTTVKPAEPANVGKTAPQGSGMNPVASWHRLRGLKGALFGLPFFALFLFSFILPFLYALWKSLFELKYSGLGLDGPHPRFAGLAQYARAFQDAAFWSGMGRVALFTCVATPLIMAFAAVEALLLDAAKRAAKKAYRLLLLVPYMVPTIVSTLVWVYLYSPDIGPLKRFFALFGLTVDFFSPQLLWASMANLLLWVNIGFNMLIMYGSLTAIDPSLYESARIDGASELRIAWSIKLPMIRGTLLLTGLLSMIGMLQLFDQPLLFRSASPQTVTANFTPIMTIYNYTFSAGGDYNYAAALSVVLALVIAAISAVVYGVTNRKGK